jgi:flagellar basal body L-ring protein FlgH
VTASPSIGLALLGAVLLSACAVDGRAEPPAPPPGRPSAASESGCQGVPDTYAVLDVREHFPGDLLTVVAEPSKRRKDPPSDGQTDEFLRAAGLTVTVVAVEPGGMLRVQGDRTTTEEHAVLTGRVRPEDVTADNTVRSSRIADPQLTYHRLVDDGRGASFGRRLRGWMWPF